MLYAEIAQASSAGRSPTSHSGVRLGKVSLGGFATRNPSRCRFDTGFLFGANSTCPIADDGGLPKPRSKFADSLLEEDGFDLRPSHTCGTHSRWISPEDVLTPFCRRAITSQSHRCGSPSPLSFSVIRSKRRCRSARGLRAARKLSNPHTLAHALALACRYHSALGETTALHQATEEVGALAAEHQFPFNAAVATIYRGWVVAGAHDAVRGVEILR
jgi:hypothetical protein